MNPTLDSIIADLENKIREGNFFNLYCTGDEWEEIVDENVNELSIKDRLTARWAHRGSVALITITYPYFKISPGTQLPSEKSDDTQTYEITFWFSRARNDSKFKCHSGAKKIASSNSLSKTFDMVWRNEMSAIQDELSREATRKLRLLLTIRKLHSEPNSYFCLLPRDMSTYLVAPMVNFENDREVSEAD